MVINLSTFIIFKLLYNITTTLNIYTHGNDDIKNNTASLLYYLFKSKGTD